MLHRSSNLLIEMFPEETYFPDLRELESRAALIMNAGNPFLADGLRPVMPNNLLVGMMNCKTTHLNKIDQKDNLLKKLQVGKNHLYISFNCLYIVNFSTNLFHIPLQQIGYLCILAQNTYICKELHEKQQEMHRFLLA